MARSKGDGARALRRKSVGKFRKLTAAEWKEIEVPFERRQISELARERIDYANMLFALVAPNHSQENSVTVKEITKQIESWQKTTRNLRRELETPRTTAIKIRTKAEIIARHKSKRAIHRIRKMPPLQFFTFTIESSLVAADLALETLKNNHQRPSSLKGDLWSAWICLIALALQDQGFKITATSLNKSKRESPFVSLIQKIQTILPTECRRFSGYESVTKGVQQARRKMGGLKQKTLMAVLGGWGGLMLTDYSADAVAKFDAAKQVTLDFLTSMTKKQNAD
ncbi:MAG: hypothetical protein NTZ72_04385 [Afipia sp.]|nr:hypothetical protein [Afipia sp.]